MNVRFLVTTTLICIIAMCLVIHVETAAKKRNYVLQVAKLDDPYADGEYFSIKSLKATKYNRTTPIVKGTIILRKDIPMDTLCAMQTYQKLGGGNYGKGPIALPEGSLCEFIQNDTVIFPAFKKSTNLPKKCPLKKMDIIVNNYDINTSNLPPELPPPNEWMAEFNLTNKQTRKTMLSLRVYLNIVHKGIGAVG